MGVGGAPSSASLPSLTDLKMGNQNWLKNHWSQYVAIKDVGTSSLEKSERHLRVDLWACKAMKKVSDSCVLVSWLFPRGNGGSFLGWWLNTIERDVSDFQWVSISCKLTLVWDHGLFGEVGCLSNGCFVYSSVLGWQTAPGPAHREAALGKQVVINAQQITNEKRGFSVALSAS